MADIETVDIDTFLKDDVPPGDVDPGLIYGKPEDVLREVARRREAGDSLAAIRRDTAVASDIPDYVLEEAAELGRKCEQYNREGRYGERKRLYSGIPPMPFKTKAERAAALAADRTSSEVS